MTDLEYFQSQANTTRRIFGIAHLVHGPVEVDFGELTIPSSICIVDDYGNFVEVETEAFYDFVESIDR